VIPRVVDRILSGAPGEVGSYYAAYKTYRWGDPHLRLISSLADRTRLAVDVGAHIGEYTFFLRRHAAKCVAFECNPALVAGLRRRFGTSVDIRADAVSDTAGETVLRIPRLAQGADLGRATIEAGNHLAGDFAGIDEVRVRTVRLDDVIDRPVGFIKVDVEGHELAVLRGATRILTADRPKLLLELEERHVPGCVAAAVTFLGGFGYRGAYLHEGRFVRLEPGTMPATPVWNYLFTSDA
jgi:FkbM family methyltransferase